MTDERRLAYVTCSLDLLGTALFAQDTDRLLKVITTDLPPDTTIVRIRQDWDDEMNGICRLLLTSESFDQVQEGERIPQINPVITVARIDRSFPNGEPGSG